ncbi:Hypothetical predicted protein [Pelobates cultripes]|uniref:Uncharacterized protein n=1 Tax=Pelobates cultripes TaxID=61616 RepID=A0AAD1SMF7_PELCU|nr:Hypothetical predicted protein [Pelobates cultripes]
MAKQNFRSILAQAGTAPTHSSRDQSGNSPLTATTRRAQNGRRTAGTACKHSPIPLNSSEQQISFWAREHTGPKSEPPSTHPKEHQESEAPEGPRTQGSALHYNPGWRIRACPAPP